MPQIAKKLLPVITLLAAWLLFWALRPDKPLTALDVRTILLQASIVCIVAVAMTLVIASGGIDLSVGSSVALCGVVAGLVLLPRTPQEVVPDSRLWLAILAAIGAGVACGLYNGLLIAVLRLPPFIATLGTLGFFRGFAKYAGGNNPVYTGRAWLSGWVQPTPSPSWLLLPPVVWLTLVIALAIAALIRFTAFGRQALAIGDNEEAARRCAVPIAAVKTAVYAICGGLVGVASVVQLARLSGSADPTIAIGLELRAVAAAVVGGAALSGGRGSILGTVCGALLMALLDNRCTALGWPNYVQEMVVGHIIIAAVAIDRIRGRR